MAVAVAIALQMEGPALAGLPPQTWTTQTTGVTATLRGVSAVSERVAWASGSRGTVLRTADGGETWQVLTVPDAAALDFRDVDAIDASTAYILSIGNGSASRIYKTTDAGATWTLQFQNEDPAAFFDAMAFWDANAGIAVSDSVGGQFVVISTTDGGRTWTRIPPDRLPPAQDNEGYFAASGTNVAVLKGTGHVWLGTGAAARARVLRSADRGATWQVAGTPLIAGPTMGIYSIAFRDPQNGIVVGGDHAKEAEAIDNVAVTRDGGATWALVKKADGTSALSGFRSVVAYVPGTSSMLAVGPSGSDISRDDGSTWAPIEGPGFHTFSFAPGLTTGWGAGGRGRVARFTVSR
jgi:photosystem II stability/assembly factor-like uncharacterized protein